jgi:hypothetical protein
LDQSVIEFAQTYGWIPVLLVVAGVLLYRGAVWLVDKAVARRDSVFLENHRASLQAIGDAARFDYQRRLADFDIYAGRRHDAVAAVYKALLDAEVGMTQMEPFARFSRFDEETDPDAVARHLERVGAPGNEVAVIREEFAKLLATQRTSDGVPTSEWPRFTSWVNATLDRARISHVTNVRNAAYHAVHSNAIYLPGAVEQQCEQILGELHMAFVDHAAPSRRDEGWDGRDALRHKTALRRGMLDLKRLMRAELDGTRAAHRETLLRPNVQVEPEARTSASRGAIGAAASPAAPLNAGWLSGIVSRLRWPRLPRQAQ